MCNFVSLSISGLLIWNEWFRWLQISILRFYSFSCKASSNKLWWTLLPVWEIKTWTEMTNIIQNQKPF